MAQIGLELSDPEAWPLGVINSQISRDPTGRGVGQQSVVKCIITLVSLGFIPVTHYHQVLDAVIFGDGGELLGWGPVRPLLNSALAPCPDVLGRRSWRCPQAASPPQLLLGGTPSLCTPGIPPSPASSNLPQPRARLSAGSLPKEASHFKRLRGKRRLEFENIWRGDTNGEE